MAESENIFGDGRPVRFGFFTTRLTLSTLLALVFSVMLAPVSRLGAAALLMVGVSQVAVRLRYMIRVEDGVLEVRNLRGSHRFYLADPSLELNFPANEGNKYRCRMDRGMRVKNETTDWVFCGATRVDCGSLPIWFETMTEVEKELAILSPNALVTHEKT